MNAMKATAHRAGVLYFLFMIVAIVDQFLLPGFTVPGDAAATALKIKAAESAYRVDLLVGFATLVIFIVLVASLHRLLRHVDAEQSLLMVLFVAIGIAVALANLLTKFAPLVLLGGPDYLSAFSGPQLDALSFGALRFHGAGTAIATIFWGLWLFPFGLLVHRSGMFPRVLGILLLVAGFAYVATGVVAIGWPEQRQLAGRVLMPLYVGEVPIIFWLLIKGAREPQGLGRAPA